MNESELDAVGAGALGLASLGLALLGLLSLGLSALGLASLAVLSLVAFDALSAVAELFGATVAFGLLALFLKSVTYQPDPLS